MISTRNKRSFFLHIIFVLSLVLSLFPFSGAQAQLPVTADDAENIEGSTDIFDEDQQEEPLQEDTLVNKVYLPLVAGAVQITADSAELSQEEAEIEAAQERQGGADALFAQISQQIPDFGGMFYDEGGQLTVYLVQSEPGAQQMAEAEIASVLGSDERLAADGTVFVLPGQYRFSQLQAWHEQLWKDVLGIPGVVLTDVDERSNRLRIGVETQAQQSVVRQQLAKLGIPREAVNIEVTEPIQLAAHTLRSRVRPLQGGLQIQFGNSLCTLGFLAVRSGVRGMVTNSHCTNIQGGVENTVYHQATTSGTTNRIGLEIRDPNYFVGGACPAGRRCRYSDTAFARIPHPSGPSVTTNHGYIARPVALGSITINHAAPRFRIVRKVATPLTGERLNKVGRTTGWSQGLVTSTCVNVNVTGTNITLLCQDFVGARSGLGDSGSPVFRITNSPAAGDVHLYGILWGINTSGTLFVFSALSTFNVQRATEMGRLTTCASGFSC